MIHAYLPAEDGGVTYGTPPPEIRLRVVRYKSTAQWGYTTAQIDVTAPEPAIWVVLEWLRRPVILVNDQGVTVWAGFINEAEVANGGLRVGASLEKMANRIQVAYSERAAGGYERRTTAALDDAFSQQRYGIKEALITIGDATADRAAAKAAELLASTATPPRLPTFGGNAAPDAGGALTATLYCTGWSNLLRWRFYARSGARVEHDGAAGLVQPIGWQLVSSDVVFTKKIGISDFDGRLGGLTPGLTVAVSGAAAANNRTFVTTQTQTGTLASYTADTISFDPSDDIFDSANGFGFVSVWSVIRISGSVSNNGIWEVDGKPSSGYITLSVPNTQIVEESAGETVTIEQAASVTVTPTAVDDLTDDEKTLTLYGYRLAQSFVATDTLSMKEIGIQAAAIGTPADALRVALYSDSGGAPDALLGSATLDPDDLPEDMPDWTLFDFDPRVALTTGTTYWIVVERTDATSAENYYAVTTSPDASGSCLAWTGSAWIANPTGETLPHTVQMVMQTTAQIEAMATASGVVTATLIQDASGIFDAPDREGDLSAYEEIDKLLTVGQSTGRRLLAQVDKGRNLHVRAAPLKPANSETTLVYTLRGRLVTTTGAQPNLEGVLPVGEWLAIERAPRHLDVSPVFVEEAEYTVGSGRYQITPEANT